MKECSVCGVWPFTFSVDLEFVRAGRHVRELEVAVSLDERFESLHAPEQTQVDSHLNEGGRIK